MSFHYIFFSLDSAGFKVMALLLSVLWQSTILFLAAGVLSYLLRNRSAAARHAVWTAAVLALPLLPLLTMGISHLDTPKTEISLLTPYEAPLSAHALIPQDKSPALLNGPLAPVAGTISPAPTLTPPSPVPEPSFRDYPSAVGLFRYLLAVSALLAWIMIQRLRIRRWIRQGAAVFDSRTLDVFLVTGKRLGLWGEIPIMEHPGVPAPLTFGIRRPVIMLPKGFAEKLSDSELRAVALHELVHIRRRDTLVLTLVAIIRAVFFFQPLVWFAARRISYYAELSCDRAALKDGADPGVYAVLLTRIASGLPRRSYSTEVAAGLLFSQSVFFRRVRDMLSNRIDRERGLTRRAMTGVILFGMIALLATLSFPLGERAASAVKWYDSKQAHPGGNWLEGTVIYPDGWPVTGAYFTVTWWEPGERVGTTVMAGTDRRGKFRIEGIPLKIVTKDYMNGRGRTYQYTFPYLETNRAHTFILREPDGFVSGRVIDESGRPVRGADVSAAPNVGPSGNLHGVVKTGWDGRFRLLHLENESHTIRAGHKAKGQGIARDIPDKSEGITIVLYKSDFLKRIYTPSELKVFEYQRRLREMGTAAQGKPAPEIEASAWVNGNPITLADMSGKITVLYFWSRETWDSIRPLVLLDYWRRNYEGKGVEFIAIHPYTTDIEAVRKLAAERSGAIPVVIDRKSPVPEARGYTFDRYGVVVDSYPKILIIDRQGKIAWRGPSGFFDASYFEPCEIENEIRKLLGENIQRADLQSGKK